MQKDINIEKYDFDEFEKEKKPYTMLLTEVIQTIKNPPAFLIWAFLQSLPTDWVPSKAHIMNHFDLSERVYQRLMSYLNQSNLIEYRRNRNCDGTLGKIKLIVLSGIKFKPSIETNQSAKNGGVVNNGSISIQNVHLHQAAILPQPGQTTRVAFGDHTKTIDLQRQELKEQSGGNPQNTELAIIRKSNPLAAFLPDKYLLMQKQLTIQCLSDEKAYALFESKFGKLEVTFEEMLYECVMYYALKPEAQNVSNQRFITWIKRERIEIYDKKPDSVAHKLYRDLTEQEKSLVSDYMHFKKYPDLHSNLTDNQKQKAQDLLDLLKSTQNMRAI